MNVVRQVGVDRIVMGSDYCFQIGDEHPVATVNRLSKSISVAEREMILGKTASLFFSTPRKISSVCCPSASGGTSCLIGVSEKRTGLATSGARLLVPARTREH